MSNLQLFFHTSGFMIYVYLILLYITLLAFLNLSSTHQSLISLSQIILSTTISLFTSIINISFHFILFI